MTKYARVVNSMAVDVRAESPEGFFTPEVAAEFVEVPNQVEDGWVLKDGVWSAPPPPEPIEPPPPAQQLIPLIGPIAFQMLFTVEELVAIDAAKSTHPEVRIFWKLLDDPRTDVVNRNLDSVKAGIYMLETLGLIAKGRAQEILYGEVTK